jgi:curved DNA-binding protein
MPDRQGRHGDLFARVQIMVPRELDERERQLFEELRADSSFHPQASVQ